jgi:hypothetical protein
VDSLPDDFPVTDVSLSLRCSACGSRNVKTQPDVDNLPDEFPVPDVSLRLR